MGGGTINTNGALDITPAMPAPAAMEWTARYDALAGRYSMTPGMELRCGIASSRAAVWRAGARCQAFSITWMLTGGGVYSEQTADSTEIPRPLSEGALLLRRPDRHSRLTLSACAAQRRCFIDIDPCLYPVAAAAIPELRTAPSVSSLPIESETLERFAAFIGVLERMDTSPPLACAGALCGIIRALYRREETAPAPDEPMRVAAMLLACEPFSATLPSIADQCGVPYGIFRKRFVAAYGQTPGKWRIERRIERAKQELAAGEPIASVADHLAYSDVYSFSHQFRGVTGTTPKQYQMKNVL
ncbi:MAG: AraC family transcriptional regulator [Oscillospiraceae bacterium]|jgi:AraC-like DNA-binding protein|nr:AraC family transcriptional regulator [Oscillospiraceae bacterium]